LLKRRKLGSCIPHYISGEPHVSLFVILIWEKVEQLEETVDIDLEFVLKTDVDCAFKSVL